MPVSKLELQDIRSHSGFTVANYVSISRFTVSELYLSNREALRNAFTKSWKQASWCYQIPSVKASRFEISSRILEGKAAISFAHNSIITAICCGRLLSIWFMGGQFEFLIDVSNASLVTLSSLYVKLGQYPAPRFSNMGRL
jgi:hypothetical protein